MSISERYKKALVTVAMGLRSEADIKKNGMHLFVKSEKAELLKYLRALFAERENLLVLKVKPTGFRSEHINITNKAEFDEFVKNVDEIFAEENEIWVISSSVVECWRCRFYLSSNIDSPDAVEMAKSTDDHILDHMGKADVPFARFEKGLNKTFAVLDTNLNEKDLQECRDIIGDIMAKYSRQFRSIKADMEMLGLPGISLDCRVNNGYDFHDFDVSYGDVYKVMDFYVTPYLDNRT